MTFRAAVLAVCAVAAIGSPARANPARVPGDLYTGHAIVTGTDGRERPAAFARALREVLVKLTAEPALADDPRLAGDDAAAEDIAEDYAYQDRMSDVPMHDEQGTRDRPYDLSVHFDPVRVDAILRRLDVPIWSERRPVVLLVRITRNGEELKLTAQAQADERYREAALAAGERYGVRVVLVPEGSSRWGASLASAAPSPRTPEAVALHGTLTWTPKAFGWVGEWHLPWNGRDHAWAISGVSFDEAFRDAVRGAAHILANREP